MYIVKGQVLEDIGTPLLQPVIISEVAAVAGATVLADVIADEDGRYQFVPMNVVTSKIRISSIGYKTLEYPVKEVPAVVYLEPAIVIEGKTTTKETTDNTLLYVGIGVLVLGTIAVMAKKAKGTQTNNKPAAGLQAPVIISF